MNKRILNVLELCKESFDEDEVEEVMEFIEVNENKLALETICAIFFEEEKTVSIVQLDVIKSVGKEMTISPSKWERLKVN
jgi:hypothetical protein